MPEDEDRQAPGSPRPFWSGTIAFGLVSVPVSLLVAYRSAGESLRMVSADGTALRRRYFCSAENRVLEADEIVRGYEVESGRYVTVEDEELESLAPEKSREIDLKRFVARDEIDPVYFERAYFLVPDQGAVKAYRLLARAMEEARRAGIATFVMRGKEYLVAILAAGGILRAETLRFHDEVRSPDQVGLPDPGESPQQRVAAVRRALGRLEAERPDDALLRDAEARRLRALVSGKLEAGEDVVAAEEEPRAPDPEAAEVVDLMQVLKRRLENDGEAPPQAEQAAARRTRPRKNPTGERGRGPLDRRSKAELYARARELDIEGRSTMSKEELIAAIREAG